MDNSWDYNQGQRELRMGKALAEGGCRDKAFLMTKIDGRTKDSDMHQIETSLERTGIDNQNVLDQAFEAVKTFHLMSEEEIAAIVAKTQRVASDGEYELFKTSSHFDMTARHPDWLGDDSPAVQV